MQSFVSERDAVQAPRATANRPSTELPPSLLGPSASTVLRGSVIAEPEQDLARFFTRYPPGYHPRQNGIVTFPPPLHFVDVRRTACHPRARAVSDGAASFPRRNDVWEHDGIGTRPEGSFAGATPCPTHGVVDDVLWRDVSSAESTFDGDRCVWTLDWRFQLFAVDAL